MNRISVIIIDDERAARNEIKRSLQPFDDFEVVGQAQDVEEARTLITTLHPALIFLDIQMPGQNGFDLLETLTDIPEVIFTTAYDKYAVRAFDHNALDYLLKPIREERFRQAIEKARDSLKNQAENTHSTPVHRRIFIREGEYCHFIRLQDIHLVESVGNYARLHFFDKKAHMKSSLTTLEETWDPDAFFRINRTQLVNTRFVTQILNADSGRLIICLINGQQLEVSGRQSAKFRKWYKHK